MLDLLVLVQTLILVALAGILLRLRSIALANRDRNPEPRLEQLFSSDLPGQFARLDARSAALDQHLRGELAQVRNDSAMASSALRGEVLANISTLGETLRNALEGFRADNTTGADRLRAAVDAQLKTLGERLSSFRAENNRSEIESREALHARLNELGAAQITHHEQIRSSVEAQLNAINQNNEKKLDEMRATVDEKLHATLQTRLTESFGQVTDQLTKVHAGLGEMTKLSAGVDDLSRIFTNVKSRGTIGEVMLETLLKQMLAPNQYEKNAKVKPNTQELVEFAVKLPTPSGEALLPIDSKFPREAWERLETAYLTGADILSAGKAFETAIRNEGRKICEKYIAPPVTTTFAIMFLPTEGLYAEVMRRDGLQTDIQQNCRVTIAGPTTLSAILSSFQMGFHMLQLQQKGDEVWKVLAGARKEFGTFETLMGTMSKDVEKVQGTIDKLAVRTRAINRTLRDVSLDKLDTGEEPLALGFGNGFDGHLSMLAASGDAPKENK